MPENILYIILLAAGASFVQRTVGFGFGIFIMTALPYLMPSYGEAVALSGPLSLTSATVVMLKYLKYHLSRQRFRMTKYITYYALSGTCFKLLTQIVLSPQD